MDRGSRPGPQSLAGSPPDETPVPPQSRSAARNVQARQMRQYRAFVELGRIVAEDEGVLTGALTVVLSAVGAPWGVAYRLQGGALELAFSEGVPVVLRANVQAFDLAAHAGFAACRAVRSRRAVTGERLFAGSIDATAATALESAGIHRGVAVPMIHRNMTAGAIVVGLGAQETIDADLLAFLQSVACLLAAPLLASDVAPLSIDGRRSSAPPSVPRTTIVDRARVDVGGLAHEATTHLSKLFQRAGCKLFMDLGEECIVDGYEDRLLLATTYFLTNALEGVRARSAMRGMPSPARRVRLSVGSVNDTVVITFEDSGMGIPPDSRARIFEPGFGTSTGGVNGLHVARQVIVEHDGHIELGSSDLGGACFKVILPAARPTARSSAAEWRATPTLPQFPAVMEKSDVKITRQTQPSLRKLTDR